MPPEAPAPAAARFYTHRGELEIDWSVHLRPAVIPPSNFNCCIGLNGRIIRSQWSPGYALDHTSTVPQSNGAICFGADRCNYTAPDLPIVSRAGVTAAPFTDFPCTVFP